MTIRFWNAPPQGARAPVEVAAGSSYLLEDGTSRLLLEDGTSSLLLEG